VFGHEFSGVVVEVGENVKSVQVGDHVSAETHIVCGHCPACRRGDAHVCLNTKIIGVDRDGCFTEYVALPEENLWKNSKELPFEIASLMEPMGNAVHTALSGEVVGKSVAVVGCGPIGLMAVAVAKAAGASKVIALDLNEYRLNLAEEMGATHLVNPSKEDPVKAVMNLTKGYGADVVLEMSGHPTGIRQGFAMLTYGGRMSMLGLPTRPVELDITNEIVFKGVTIHGITGRRMYRTWEQTAGLLESGLVDLSKLITHRLPLEDFEEGFELMKSGNCGKVVFSV
jgi:threonine 3-dehydrogenase